MLGAMMLPTVLREREREEGICLQTTEDRDQTDGTCSNGGVTSPAISTNSEDSNGPIPSPQTLDPGRDKQFPLPAKLHDPLDIDLDSCNNNLIAARPTVPRLYSSYSSQRKDGGKGEMTGQRGPRASRLLNPEQLDELERMYQKDPYPDYFQLGIRIGLKSHQVRHWFQTRRKTNRGKRPRPESDDGLMDETAEDANPGAKYDEDTPDNLVEHEVRDFSQKRRHLNPPSHHNGHTPPVTLPKSSHRTPSSLDLSSGYDIGPISFNPTRLPKSMAPISAPQAHVNGLTSHPISTATSIYRMLNSQPPSHRPGSIPPNVNVALHPAFGMQWQLPTPAVDFSETETEEDYDDSKPIDLSSSSSRRSRVDDRWRGRDSTDSRHVPMPGDTDQIDDYHHILPGYPISHRGTPDMQNQIKMETTLSEDGDGDSPSDGGWRRRRKRTVFTLMQLQRMEEIFKVTHYPSYADRDEIAQELGLTDETVRVWFKNRRAKVMREKGDVKAQGSLKQVVDDLKAEQGSP